MNYVAPHERATAVALSIFAIHLLGDVPSPSLIGAISDAGSLEQAVRIVPIAIMTGGIIWTFTAVRKGSDW